MPWWMRETSKQVVRSVWRDAHLPLDERHGLPVGSFSNPICPITAGRLNIGASGVSQFVREHRPELVFTAVRPAASSSAAPYSQGRHSSERQVGLAQGCSESGAEWPGVANMVLRPESERVFRLVIMDRTHFEKVHGPIAPAGRNVHWPLPKS